MQNFQTLEVSNSSQNFCEPWQKYPQPWLYIKSTGKPKNLMSKKHLKPTPSKPLRVGSIVLKVSRGLQFVFKLEKHNVVFHTASLRVHCHESTAEVMPPAPGTRSPPYSSAETLRVHKMPGFRFCLFLKQGEYSAPLLDYLIRNIHKQHCLWLNKDDLLNYIFKDNFCCFHKNLYPPYSHRIHIPSIMQYSESLSFSKDQDFS